MKLTLNPNVNPKDLGMIVDMVWRCMEHLYVHRRENGLRMTKASITNAMEKTVVRDFQNGRGFAGKGVIYVNMECNDIYRKQLRWVEYKAFGKDEEIGDVKVHTREQWFWVFVAHEVSHHVQRTIAKRSPYPWGEKVCKKPHGYGFRRVYRILRRDFVNPMIKPVRGYAEDDLVAFAKVYCGGSYGKYSGCRTLESKLARFKALKEK